MRSEKKGETRRSEGNGPDERDAGGHDGRACARGTDRSAPVERMVGEGGRGSGIVLHPEVRDRALILGYKASFRDRLWQGAGAGREVPGVAGGFEIAAVVACNSGRRCEVGGLQGFVGDFDRVAKPGKFVAGEFYLNDKEIQLMVGMLLGQVSEKIPLAGMRKYSSGEKKYLGRAQSCEQYNCYGCHKIDGVGGKLSEAFEDKNFGPPYLVQQGHRVQPDWFANFLRNVHPIRSYVKVRMPTFPLSADELNTLVMGFQPLNTISRLMRLIIMSCGNQAREKPRRESGMNSRV